MSFNLTPAKPAVTRTEIVTVEPATPATVTVTVSLHEALILAAAQGASTGDTPDTFYKGLRDHALFRAYHKLVVDAIAYDEAYQKANLALAEFSADLAKLRRKTLEV